MPLQILVAVVTIDYITGLAAALKAQNDPNYVVNWKAKNGWFQIDAATLIAIADAVRAHMQACFDKEREL